MTLSEIWFDESFTENDVSVSVMFFERKDRIENRYRGVGMHLQNEHCARRTDLETNNLEYIWIEVIPEHFGSVWYRLRIFDKFSPLYIDKANETKLEIFVLGNLDSDKKKM